MPRKTKLVSERLYRNEAALALVRAWGREGGKLRWKNVSAEDRRAHAKKAVRARWVKAKAKAKKS